MTHGTVLFLAYHFPPNISSVAGVRGGNIALELAKNGWLVKVITPAAAILSKVDPIGQPLPSHPNLEIIETGHDFPELAHWWVKERPGRFFKVAGKLGRGFCQALDFDYALGWIRHVKEAANAFKKGDIDLVLTTGSPYMTFNLAAQLASSLNCPYVLDYRDLWTNDPHHFVKKPWIIHEEKRLLAEAGAVVIVSNGFKEKLAQTTGINKITVITNGYDSKLLNSIEPKSFSEPAFVYTGRFMPPLSTPLPIMAALAKLQQLAPEKPWKFHYYGQNGEIVEKAAQKYGLQSRVINHNIADRKECLAATKGARGSFVSISEKRWADTAERGIITGKIFEPLGLNTPVIAITPHDSEVAHIVQNTNGGRAFWAGEIAEMAAYLKELLSTDIKPQSHSTAYSWQELGKRYSNLLKEVIA